MNRGDSAGHIGALGKNLLTIHYNGLSQSSMKHVSRRGSATTQGVDHADVDLGPRRDVGRGSGAGGYRPSNHQGKKKDAG